MNITIPAGQRALARRDCILEAAAQLFLELGFGATTIDMIVERAGGSKATLYKFFATKEELFAAIVEETVGDIVRPLPDAGRLNLSLRETLLTIAREHMASVLSERHVRLMRIVAAESARFPELGALYYRLGPAAGHEKLERYLADQVTAGSLVIEDVGQAAAYFYGMLLHKATLQRLYGINRPPDEPALHRFSQQVVDDFLSLYRTI